MSTHFDITHTSVHNHWGKRKLANIKLNNYEHAIYQRLQQTTNSVFTKKCIILKPIYFKRMKSIKNRKGIKPINQRSQDLPQEVRKRAVN